MRGTVRFKCLTALMVVTTATATACSKNVPEEQAAPKAETNASQQQKIDPLGKYDPPIEITTVRGIDPNAKYRDGESLESNLWTKIIEKELGVKLKNLWTVPNPQYEQKMNVTITSNDLPEFMGLTASQFMQLAENGQLMDIKDLVDKYASPMVKEYLKSDGGLALETATIKGRLMGIPTLSSVIDSSPILYVRTDWLKKLSLPEPKTMDDVLKIVDAFTNRDPDGNGKKDTVGLLASKELWGGLPGFTGFFNSYHAYPKIWIKDAGGKIVYGGIQPEMKPALAKLQELYKSGSIDKEFGVKDAKKAEESVASGKNGVFFGAMWAPLTGLQSNRNNDPSAEWQPFPILSADGKPAAAQNNAPSGAFVGINKNAKHPEAVIKMLNLFVEKMWGATANPELATEEATKLGFHKYPPVTIFVANKNLTQHLKVTEALKTKDASKLNAEEKGTYDTILKFQGGDQKGWGTDKVFGEKSSFAVINSYKNNNLLMRDEMYLAPTPTMVQKKATLEKMQDEMITKIILGAPLDEFDKFVSDWKKLGGDDIAKEINDAFAARK